MIWGGTCAKGGKGGVHTRVITRKLCRFLVIVLGSGLRDDGLGFLD